MKEDYQKSFKKSTLFFLLKPVPFNRQSYQKQKGHGTSAQLLFMFWKKFRKISLLVISYLTKFDDVIWSGCWVISKIASANLCKPIHDVTNYSTTTFPFVSGKCGKGKITKVWISWEWKELFWWNKKKTLFIVLEGLSFSGKTKIW